MNSAPISRRRRLAVNSVFSTLGWVAPILIGFFTTPILVKRLGTEQYGLYAVITGFVTYSFSLGLGKIAAKYVAEYRASGEVEKVAPTVTATFLATLAIGIVGTSVLALTARFLVTNVLLIADAFAATAVTAIYWACLFSLAAMVGQVYQLVLQGAHRFGILLAITNVNGILIGVGSIAIAVAGGGVVELMIWSTVAAALVALTYFVFAKSSVPELRFDLIISSEIRRAVVSYGGSIIFYQILANLLFVFERSFVMRRFGPEASAYYAVPMLLAIYLHAFVGTIAVALFPAVNELLADPEKQIELYKKATKLVFAIVIFAVATAFATGRTALAVWINADFSQNSYTLLVFHTLTFGTIALLIVAWQYAESYGHAKINAAATGVWLIVGIPLMILSAARFGPAGVAAARFAAVAVTVPIVFYVERRFLGGVLSSFWISLIGRGFVAAAAAIIAEAALIALFLPGWTGLLFAGAGGAAVFSGLLYACGYISADEKQSINRGLAATFGAVSRALGLS